MSVLIKNMEMPTNCADCPLNYDQMACAVTWTRWWSDSMVIMNFDSDKERMPNCPLIEVPTPHGRLIDADELKKKVLKWLPSDPCGQEEKEFPFETDICVSMLMEIEESEPIIEAEGET